MDFLKHAIVLVVIEANLLTIASQVMHDLKDYHLDDVEFICEDKSSKNGNSYEKDDLPGIVTTRENKPEMVENLIYHYLSKNRLVFYRHFLTIDQDNVVIDDLREEIVRQFRNFCRKMIAKNLPDQTIDLIPKYSGKHRGNNDDFVLAILLGCHVYTLFYALDKYRRLW